MKWAKSPNAKKSTDLNENRCCLCADVVGRKVESGFEKLDSALQRIGLLSVGGWSAGPFKRKYLAGQKLHPPATTQ